MKKLFYSFLMLATMSLTFVACEKPTPETDQDPEPEVKSDKEPSKSVNWRGVVP